MASMCAYTHTGAQSAESRAPGQERRQICTVCKKILSGADTIRIQHSANKEDKRISGSDKTNHGCTPLKAFPFLSPDCMCIGGRCICDAHHFSF